MSLECSECEHDLRRGHDPSCSRYKPPCPGCGGHEEGCPQCWKPLPRPQVEEPPPGDPPHDPEIGVMLRASRAYRQRIKQAGEHRVRVQELREMIAALDRLRSSASSGAHGEPPPGDRERLTAILTTAMVLCDGHADEMAGHLLAHGVALRASSGAAPPSTTTTEANVDAPRTYESAWQFGKGDTAKLLTAEDWLEEEADVDERVPPPPGDEGPSRAGILRAIAQEIRVLRRERTQWADECTRRASSGAGGGESSAEDLAHVLRTCPDLVLKNDPVGIAEDILARLRMR